MTDPEPTIRVSVDPTNPGQFFACCGLRELAGRLWPGAEGWFAADGREFRIAWDGGQCGKLWELVEAVAHAQIIHARADDLYSSPFIVGKPFRPLSLDWWETDLTGAKDLKVWAGKMESYGIAVAMQNAMRDERFREPNLFDVSMVVMNPDDPVKKREPYYYDARRAPNAHSRDTGFSANDLGLTSTAFPAVELLCVIGLQVARPAFTNKLRNYDYFTWAVPLPTNLLLAVSSGALTLPSSRKYRFVNWFRTGQKKHKAFRPAIPLFT